MLWAEGSDQNKSYIRVKVSNILVVRYNSLVECLRRNMLPSPDRVDSLGDDSRSTSPPWQDAIASYLLHNMDNSSSVNADQKRDSVMQEQLSILVRELVKIQREKKTSDVIAQLARLQLPQQEESHQLLDDIKRCFSVPQKLDRSVSEPFPMSQVGKKLVNQTRYKTELCRQYEEKGQCRYGDKCQFAHGDVERRSLDRHPKYKTEMCRTYHQHGFCNYGLRCNFIHNEEERLANMHATIVPHSGIASPLLVSPGELHLGGCGPSSGSSGHSSIQELSRSMSIAGYASFARPTAESPSCSSVPSPFESQFYPLVDPVTYAGRTIGFSPPVASTSVLPPSVDPRPKGRPILSRSVSAAVQSGMCGNSGRMASPEVFRFDYSSFAS